MRLLFAAVSICNNRYSAAYIVFLPNYPAISRDRIFAKCAPPLPKAKQTKGACSVVCFADEADAPTLIFLSILINF